MATDIKFKINKMAIDTKFKINKMATDIKFWNKQDGDRYKVLILARWRMLRIGYRQWVVVTLLLSQDKDLSRNSTNNTIIKYKISTLSWFWGFIRVAVYQLNAEFLVYFVDHIFILGRWDELWSHNHLQPSC